MPNVDSEYSAEETVTVTSENWWIKDLDNPNNNLEIMVSNLGNVGSDEGQGVFDPLGREDYVVLSDVVKTDTLSVTCDFIGMTGYDKLVALRKLQRTMHLESPVGRTWWFRFGEWSERYENMYDPWIFVTFGVTEVASPEE